MNQSQNLWISLDLNFFSNMAAFILSPRVLIIYAWSSLLTYLHIPSGFHNQRSCDGYRELYSGRNIDFTL